MEQDPEANDASGDELPSIPTAQGLFDAVPQLIYNSSHVSGTEIPLSSGNINNNINPNGGGQDNINNINAGNESAEQLDA